MNQILKISNYRLYFNQYQYQCKYQYHYILTLSKIKAYNKLHNIIYIDKKYYVASSDEIQKYEFEKRRAYKWIGKFSNSKEKILFDTYSIGNAIKGHFHPIHMSLSKNPNPKMRQNLIDSALIKCGQMLKDLSCGMNKINLVVFLNTIGKIINHSIEDKYGYSRCKQHPEVILRFMELIDLGYDKFEAKDLATIIWALGQFGPQILKIKAHNYPDSKKLVFKLINKSFENLLDMNVANLTKFIHGISNLHIKLEDENHQKIHSFLKININVTEAVNLFKITKFLAERQITIDNDLLKTLVLRCETKIRINKFGITEMMSLIYSLSQMRAEKHICQNLCSAIEESTISALNYCLKFKNEIFSLMHVKQCMHGFVNLDYIPNDEFLDLMSNYILELFGNSNDVIKFDTLRDYAEFGKVSDVFFDMAKIKIKNLGTVVKRDFNFNLNRIWRICEALAILEYLDLETFESALMYSDRHRYDFVVKDSDCIKIYNCILHMKYILKIKKFENEEIINKWLKICKNAWDVSFQLKKDKIDGVLDLMQEMEYNVIKDDKVTEDEILVSKIEIGNNTIILEDEENKYFLNKRRIKGSESWKKALFDSLNIKLIFLDFKAIAAYHQKWQKMEYLKCFIQNQIN